MNIIEILLLVHVFVLGIPMLAVSIFLLLVTVKIRSLLERNAIQRIVFRGILVAGYLFLFIAVMHLLEHAFDWYGYADLSLEAGLTWHGATLVLLLVISYSFYSYLKTLSWEEQIHLAKDK